MPRFDKTYCSQCGGEFGPGDSGFSHCDQHELSPAVKMAMRVFHRALARRRERENPTDPKPY